MNTVLMVLLISILFAIVLFIVIKKKEGVKHVTKETVSELSNQQQSNIKIEVTSSFTEKNLTNITEIVLATELGGELVFSRPHIQSEVKYYEVMASKACLAAGQVFQSVTPLLERKFILSELDKLAPHGLFAATVDTKKLSRFKDETYSTMVRDSKNNLVNHAGFKSVGDMSKFSPLALMNVGLQGAAIISSQYYLEQINSQLTSIDKKVSELIELHHEKELSIFTTSA